MNRHVVQKQVKLGGIGVGIIFQQGTAGCMFEPPYSRIEFGRRVLGA